MARLAIVLSLLFSATWFIGCSRQPAYPSPPMAGGNVVIEIAALQADAPAFFTYHYQGKKINFFVFKDHEKILSFLDACAGCYPHKRGYRYDDGAVICRYCSQKFPVSKLEKGLGSCYPIRLGGRMENGKYLIPLFALESAVNQF
jgi:uncharacterized membrane protein